MIGQDAFWVLIPEFLLLFGALATYTSGRTLGRMGGRYLLGGIATFFSLMAAGVLVLAIPAVQAGRIPVAEIVPGSIRLALDPLALYLGLIGTILLVITCIYSIRYLGPEAGTEKYYALLLLMTAGVLGIGLAQDLFNMYVFFELMSIASIPLVAYHTGRWEPVKAGMKYAVMSVVGSVTALFGISYIFVYTGTLDLAAIGPALAAVTPETVKSVTLIAGGLVLAGFGVKAAIVPFHTWLPDAHSAAPSSISAMLSGLVIQAGLIALVRVLAPLSGAGTGPSFGLVLALFAVLTMCTGNLLALRQRDIKKMLACSSIAQMGYIMLAFAFGIGLFGQGTELGFIGGLYHILGHVFMKGGAFLCAGAFIYATGMRNLDDMKGIGRALPIAGLTFSVCILALNGMPPMTGFISELFICRAGIESGLPGMVFVLIMLVNIAVSLAYYIPAINTIMLTVEKRKDVPAIRPVPVLMQGAIAFTAVCVLVLGIFPQTGLAIVSPAAAYLSGLFLPV
ncbi:MAG: proton-conducting transporter membrane subunit [Methanoregula sp.]|nr:proton-conducting transporter membrane subunit [Methanoregula sp.]